MSQIKEIPTSERDLLAALLDEGAASDAMAAYYALEHPAEKVRLFGSISRHGDPRGFLVVARTGMDLFRPLVIPFAARREILTALLRRALDPSQSFLISLPADQLKWIGDHAEIEEAKTSELLRLEPDAYEPVLNVLVVEAESPDGSARYEIQTAEGLRAAAGVNWRGRRYAEVYLDASDAARGRSLTKSVLSAMVGRLLGQRRIALYKVETQRISVKTEALNLGFRPTGHRTAIASAVLLQHPEPELRRT